MSGCYLPLANRNISPACPGHGLAGNGRTCTVASPVTRNLLGIGGGLAATVDQSGTVTLQLVNLHGDLVATAADSSSSTGISSYSESTEFGAPRTPASAPDSYGWLGAKRRSSNDLAGLTLMGVRLYDPATGRFLSVDPVPGGSDNAYVYVNDPIDQFDLDGNCWGLHCLRRWAQQGYRQTVRAVAVVPYAVYYGGYRMNRWAAQHWWAAPVRSVGWYAQGFGLGGDVALDALKSHTGFRESIYDEHKYGSMNPWHKGNGGHTWLPGLYRSHGRTRLDWAW